MTVLPTFPHRTSYPELAQFAESAPARLRSAALADASGILVVDGDRSWSRAGLLGAVEEIQQALRDRGVTRGDVVSVQLPNWWEMVATAYAVWGMGAVLNPITPIYRGTELKAIFAAARPAAVITPGRYRDVDFARMSREALADAGVPARVLAVREGGRAFGASGARAGQGPELDLDPDAVSLLMFTSGTTGTPKGVLHNQRTLLYEAWSIAERFALSGGTTVFMPSPLTHITGLLYGILLPLVVDSGAVLLDRWKPQEAAAEIESNACTFSVGATPFLAGLVTEYLRLGKPSTLEWFICGGADVPPTLVREARAAMGTRVVRAYGLTEMPTVTCGDPSGPPDLLESTDGALVGSSQARLANERDGVGEIEVHGPEMFVGYLDPASNAGAFSDDGWFRTGDLGRLEDGHLTIAGRSKDVIVRGGENISAKEVEDLIQEMPNVAEVAVVGVPDPILGERACAVIVPRGTPPSLADIGEHLVASEIARQKIPERLLIQDALPRTASGKIQKHLLRETARNALAGQGDSSC